MMDLMTAWLGFGVLMLWCAFVGASIRAMHDAIQAPTVDDDEDKWRRLLEKPR